MLIRTSIALAGVAFLGFASVASAAEDSKDRQVIGFSFHVGPLGQYFGSNARLRLYNAYGYAPYGYAQQHHSSIRARR
jgi:hypothetical protein